MSLLKGKLHVIALALLLLLAMGRLSLAQSDAQAQLDVRAARLAERVRAGELTLAAVQSDTEFPERRHLRYDQRLSGVRVFGAQLVQQLDGSGRTLSILGHADAHPAAPRAVPTLSADQAVRAALAAFPAGAVVPGEPELVWLPRQTTLVLTWMMHVRFDLGLERVFVDAHSGAIAHRYSDLQTDAIAGLGVGVWADQKKLSVDKNQSTYRAHDLLRPPGLVTYDLRGDIGRLTLVLNQGFRDPNDVGQDADNDWTDGAVVDAHVYAGLTYDYYYKRHGRRGLNDHDLPIASFVHILPASYQYANAFWDTSASAMFYGDGDGATSSFSGAVDVAAHEMTHGVTDYSWRGIYQNESGALNEAFSDIMGTGVEFMFQPEGNGRLMADWYLGEDLFYFFGTPRYAFRSLENPGLFCHPGIGCDPDHYSKLYRGSADNGGVHINSGIANQAFYLLAQGGTNRTSHKTVTGLGGSNGGREKAEKIFYRGFVFFLTPSATFHDARAATLRAARELYGEAEATQVAAAWSAVGVE
jgi:Zn-dependent metalloprotease